MNLETLRNDIPIETARNAYAFTSFVPEKRGEREVDDYTQTLTEIYNTLKGQVKNDEMQKILDEEFPYFREKYRQLTLSYLHTHSRLASWAIVGPSKFPSRRMEKVNRSCDNKWKAINEFRVKGMKAIQKKMGVNNERVIRSGESNTIQKLEEEIRKLEDHQERMKKVNKIIRECKRKNFTTEESIAALKDLLDTPVAIRILSPDFMGQTGYRTFELTNNSANIRRLKERLVAEKRRQVVSSEGNKEYKFLDATIVENYEMNRLQISHESIPPAELRRELKNRGFHWSRSNTCWQRQLTDNAIMALKELIGDYTEEVANG